MACEIGPGTTVSVSHGGTVDLDRFVLDRAAGKSVLNIGAGGNMFAYLPDRLHLSLHSRLGGAARELVGMEIDREAIEHANRHGVGLIYGDCQSFDLGRAFDVVLLIDVIEHVERPGDALEAIKKHLAPGGEIIVSTPNATFLGGFIKGLIGRDPGVYYDHVACYMPENLKVLALRHGLTLSELYFHTLMNRLSRSNEIKSEILHVLGRLAPRLSNSFVAVLHKA